MGAILLGYDVESAAVGEGLARILGPSTPAYRYALEPDSTRVALEVIAGVHADFEAPGTLFTCGRTLLHALDPIHRALELAPLDLQQHTYSHVVFRDVRFAAEGRELCLPESSPIVLEEELGFTSELMERHFGAACVGLRTPFGYYRGLRDRPDLLRIVSDAGLRYVSSWGRDEHDDNPSPLEVQPFSYAEQGYDELLEIPFQFWLDAIWFDRHGYDNGRKFGEALCGAIDVVADRDLVYGACFHDWVVVAAAEEQTGWIRRALAHARDRDVEILSYTDYWRAHTADGA